MMVDICWKDTVRGKAESTITYSRSQYLVASSRGGSVFSPASSATGNSRCGAYAKREAYGKFARTLCKAKPIADEGCY